LIVVGSLLDWNNEKGKLFEIVIQFAAILAVCWQYRQRLWVVAATLPRDSKIAAVHVDLVLAFLPAAVLGVLLIGKIKQYLFAPISGRRRVHCRRLLDSVDRKPQAHAACPHGG